MKTGIHPIDIEALERERQPWDFNYIANVLYELISRQRGYIDQGFVIQAKLTPKDPEGANRGQ